MNASSTSTDLHEPSPQARNLRWLLTGLVDEVPGLRSVVVVSSDGLLLISSEADADTGREDGDGPAAASEASAASEVPEAAEAPGASPEGPAGSTADLAALVSGIASLTFGAARLMETGQVKQTVVTMTEGHLFVMSISDGSLLGVHADAECDLSVVAYHMALFVGRAGHVLTPELRTELRRAYGDGR
ncbi:roadblock/LC7 domain-containing protein [Streptomyces sp. HB2AG]|uniref:roadblock/LC7 domain-containing protein n=1 Tax=Streptomyces sp. HB2AG TaxID=2983400 RepID=UPI0022AAC210|nr:roadblock/LC7 domain-containing protein [Streptomyces sp. HB2AG]MCZ2524210.1 roadblock/LC7 domain-containing protein [Streptomyces sp. HB2AG]